MDVAPHTKHYSFTHVFLFLFFIIASTTAAVVVGIIIICCCCCWLYFAISTTDTTRLAMMLLMMMLSCCYCYLSTYFIKFLFRAHTQNNIFVCLFFFQYECICMFEQCFFRSSPLIPQVFIYTFFCLFQLPIFIHFTSNPSSSHSHSDVGWLVACLPCLPATFIHDDNGDNDEAAADDNTGAAKQEPTRST